MSASDDRLQAPHPSESDVTHSVWASIDELRDRFEAAWMSAKPVPIEDVLSQAQPDERPRLLEALLKIELHFKSVDNVSREDYQRRFPDYLEQVARAFERLIDTQPPVGQPLMAATDTKTVNSSLT